jgi:hypothetical protein
MVFQVLKYEVFVDCAIGGLKIPPDPQPLSPVALSPHQRTAILELRQISGNGTPLTVIVIDGDLSADWS